jgi:hypothetical protein
MKLYRVIVSLDVEANDEDDACRVAERECSSAFNSCESVRVLVSYDAAPGEAERSREDNRG